MGKTIIFFFQIKPKFTGSRYLSSGILFKRKGLSVYSAPEDQIQDNSVQTPAMSTPGIVFNSRQFNPLTVLILYGNCAGIEGELAPTVLGCYVISFIFYFFNKKMSVIKSKHLIHTKSIHTQTALHAPSPPILG